MRKTIKFENLAFAENVEELSNSTYGHAPPHREKNAHAIYLFPWNGIYNIF